MTIGILAIGYTGGGSAPDELTLHRKTDGKLEIKSGLTYPAGSGAAITGLSLSYTVPKTFAPQAASGDSGGGQYAIAVSRKFTTTKSTKLIYLTYNVAGGQTGLMKIGVYSDNAGSIVGGTLLGYSIPFVMNSFAGTQTILLNFPVFLNSGVSFWLAVIKDTAPANKERYTTSIITPYYAGDGTFTLPATFPAKTGDTNEFDMGAYAVEVI